MSYTSSSFKYRSPIPQKATTSLNDQFDYSLRSLSSPSVSDQPLNISQSTSNPNFNSNTNISPNLKLEQHSKSNVNLKSSTSVNIQSKSNNSRYSSLNESLNNLKSASNIPNLEELLDDCFKYSINQPLTDSKIDIVKKFEKYMNNLHTQENLSFLIEIFKYEYYYDKIYPNHLEQLRLSSPSPVHYSNSFLNRSLDKSLDDLPYPTNKSTKMKTSSSRTANKSRPKFSNHQRSFSANSVKSEDHEPTSVFVSTIDDLGNDEMSINNSSMRGLITPSSNRLNQVWDDLRDNNVSDEEDDDESNFNNDDILSVSDIDLDSDDEELSNIKGKLTHEDRNLLTKQWDRIINCYIHHDAPDQINISNKSSREILQDDLEFPDKIHDPIILMRAKNEILQLIKENAYQTFKKNYKPLESEHEETINYESPNIILKKPINTRKSSPNPSNQPNFSSSPSSLTYQPRSRSISPIQDHFQNDFLSIPAPNSFPTTSCSHDCPLNCPSDCSNSKPDPTQLSSSSPPPTASNVNRKKSRFLHLSSPTFTTSSSSSSSANNTDNNKKSISPCPNASLTTNQHRSVTQSSSIPNFIGHLKSHHIIPSNNTSEDQLTTTSRSILAPASTPSTNRSPPILAHANTTNSRPPSAINTKKQDPDLAIHPNIPSRPASTINASASGETSDVVSPTSGGMFKFGKIWKSKKR